MQLRLRAFLVLMISTVVNAAAQPASTPASVEAALITEGLFRAIDVKFESGRSTILPTSLSTLDAVADILIRHTNIRLEIGGHTDASGSEPANLRLSEDRARAVEAYLVARRGISPARLEARGYGEAFPVALNDSPTGRSLNRRVEFRVLHPNVTSQTAPVEPSEPQVNADSLREALERQVEQAVRAALGSRQPDADLDRLTRLEQELSERLARIESRLNDDMMSAKDEQPHSSSANKSFALLPFTGMYFDSDFPILIGLRADIPTSLLGSARFQPEVAAGLRPDNRATIVNANLVFQVRLGSAGVTPFFGAGLGFHNLEDFESVLNVLAGTEYRFEFGVLFAELMTQDFGDYNRIVFGYRQAF